MTAAKLNEALGSNTDPILVNHGVEVDLDLRLDRLHYQVRAARDCCLTMPVMLYL